MSDYFIQFILMMAAFLAGGVYTLSKMDCTNYNYAQDRCTMYEVTK